MLNHEMKDLQKHLKALSERQDLHPKDRAYFRELYELSLGAEMTYDEIVFQAQQSPLNNDGVIDWLDDDFTLPDDD